MPARPMYIKSNSSRHLRWPWPPSRHTLRRKPERYRMERTEDGFVRMDQSTGQMSVCRERRYRARLPRRRDEREAYHREIG